MPEALKPASTSTPYLVNLPKHPLAFSPSLFSLLVHILPRHTSTKDKLRRTCSLSSIQSTQVLRATCPLLRLGRLIRCTPALFDAPASPLAGQDCHWHSEKVPRMSSQLHAQVMSLIPRISTKPVDPLGPRGCRTPGPHYFPQLQNPGTSRCSEYGVHG